MVCPPVRGDNQRALAGGLYPVQPDKLLYYYCIPPSSAWILLIMKYFVIKFGISGKGRISNIYQTFLVRIFIFGRTPRPICTTIPRYPIFSTRYSVLCKIYTGYHGASEIEHGLCACTVDNPLAEVRVLSLRTGAQTMLCLSLITLL